MVEAADTSRRTVTHFRRQMLTHEKERKKKYIYINIFSYFREEKEQDGWERENRKCVVTEGAAFQPTSSSFNWQTSWCNVLTVRRMSAIGGPSFYRENIRINQSAKCATIEKGKMFVLFIPES